LECIPRAGGNMLGMTQGEAVAITVLQGIDDSGPMGYCEFNGRQLSGRSINPVKPRATKNALID
jgi:hypothetical protein